MLNPFLFRYNFWLEKRDGHKLRVDLFDEDSFSRDDYLGKIVIDIEDYIGNSTAESDDGLAMVLEDDPLENSSNDPTLITGEVTFQLRYWIILIKSSRLAHLNLSYF